MSLEKIVGSNGVTWKVRWYEGRRQRSRGGFPTKKAAQAFDAARRTAAASGLLVPTRAETAVTVAEEYQTFIASRPHLSPTTLVSYETLWRVHVDPRWGNRRLQDVRREDIQGWVTLLARKRSASTVRHAHRLLSMVLAAAVFSGRLPANPAVGVKLPRLTRSERPRAISVAQVEALASSAGDWWGPWIRWQAYTGMRLGETSALRVKDVDLDRRRVQVMQTLVAVHAELVTKPPKSHQSRVVPIPHALMADLAERCQGKRPDDLVWTLEDGVPILGDRLRSTLRWKQLVTQNGLPDLRIHDLRHSSASLLIRHGASVLDVSRILGHHSAAFTLSVYGHSFEDTFDHATSRLDAAISAEHVRNMPASPEEDAK